MKNDGRRLLKKWRNSTQKMERESQRWIGKEERVDGGGGAYGFKKKGGFITYINIYIL